MENRIEKEDCRLYIQMLQDVIKRLASNSANCKQWMITIVTALLALMIGAKELRPYILLSAIPVIGFWFVDYCYLINERRFRKHESEFVRRMLYDQECIEEMLFSFDKKNPKVKIGYVIRTLLSFSLLTYPTVGVIIIFLHWSVPQESQNEQNLQAPLVCIVERQDSIVDAIHKLTEKYTPVEIQTKEFHNSSFFQVGNVDSVKVNVYKVQNN